MTASTTANGGGLWPSLPAPLGSALDGALSGAPAQSGVSAPEPAAGAVGGAAPAVPGIDSGAAWTRNLPSWLQYMLFHDWFTGTDGRSENASVKSFLVLLVFVILGAGFIYFGVKTLAD